MQTKDHVDEPWDKTANVDPAEIDRFEALADEWWNPSGKFRAVHKFNEARLHFIIQRIISHFRLAPDREPLIEGLKILDVGCGAGLVSEPLAASGATVIGIDATSRNVETARNHAVQSGYNIDYRHCLAEHVLETDDRFDVVLNLEVIEHVTNPNQLMSECCRLLNPGGLMIVATLNRTLRSFLIAIIGAEYFLRWLPIGTHDWQKFLRPQEITDMLTPHGLVNCETIGVNYNPLIRRWRLSDNSSVNYLLVAQKKGSDRNNII
jgi:2-polyprenyl-6-hydroxyphenyl methylase/3-demethylubiquinone-9 3-methyltransferase